MSRFFIAGLLAVLFMSSAFSYTLTTTDSGQTIRWRYGQKFFLAGNPKGQDRLSANFIYQLVVSGLQQWKWASGSQLDFEYWQGTDLKSYPADLKQNGLSTLFFASNSNEISDPNIIGFTQVWFNSDSGDLLETDIMLNDRNYQLTDQPADTSAVANSNWGSRPKVYVGNIITHELGHAIGLSHSQNINASMLYVEYPEQAKLGCDDVAGARHLYPQSGSATGALAGTILTPSGEPAAGAVITAVSKTRGVVLASVMSDQNGNFTFGALTADEIGLVVQAYQGSNHSIPAAVQPHAQEWCSSGSFPTNFVTESDRHSLKIFKVGAGGLVHAGTYRIQCSEVNALTAMEPTLNSELLVDSANPGTSKTYHFDAHGPFSISALSYLLLSSVKVDLKVSDAQGQVLAVQKESPLYLSTSSFKIPDTRITGWAQGPVTLTITSTRFANAEFPIPSIYPTQIPYFILAFDSRAEGVSFADARCSAPETFAIYRSPAGEPIRFGASSTSRDNIGFCGNAQAGMLNEHAAARSKAAPLGSILAWFLPFWVALATQLYSKHRRAKLRAR